MHTVVLAAIVASSSDSDDHNWSLIGLAFFAAGFVFYFYIYARYRNADKRYHYESHTQVAQQNMAATDDFLKSRTGLSSKHVSGANNDEVDGASKSFMASMSSLVDGFGSSFGLPSSEHRRDD